MSTEIQHHLTVDARSPIPIHRQLTEQLKHVIEGGRVPRDQVLPSIRELAGLLGINPNTVARVIDDLKRSGHVEARRGKGVFVAPRLPTRPSSHLRERFLQDVVVQAAARGMTADDLAVSVLSLAGVRPAPVQATVEMLLVENSPADLEFFARELEAHLPVRAQKALLGDLATTVRRQKPPGPWAAAATRLCHLPEVERLLKGRGIPVIGLRAEAHLETLHQLAQLRSGTRVGVAAAIETARDLEQSIANAGLPNIVRVGICHTEGPALDRLVRRADVVVCSSAAAERVRGLAGSTAHVMVDDRTLDRRAIEILATLLTRPNGDGGIAAPPPPGTVQRPRRGKAPSRRGLPKRRSG